MRLIDADDLIREIEENKSCFIGAPDEVELHDAMCDYAIEAITNAPTIERPKGKWCTSSASYFVSKYGTTFLCDCCGERVDTEYNFCPNCGADMRE